MQVAAPPKGSISVIVRFVLKQQQPRLFYAVRLNFYFYGAGVDFLRLVKLIELSVSLQIFDRNRRQIHKAYGLCSAELPADGKVILIRPLQKPVLKFHIVNNG